MTELYIIRHGRTVWNAAGKIQGSADIELTEDGRMGAVLTGKAWEAVRLHFDAVYSSPLKRAYETALLVSNYTFLPARSCINARTAESHWRKFAVGPPDFYRRSWKNIRKGSGY